MDLVFDVLDLHRLEGNHIEDFEGLCNKLKVLNDKSGDKEEEE